MKRRKKEHFKQREEGKKRREKRKKKERKKDWKKEEKAMLYWTSTHYIHFSKLAFTSINSPNTLWISIGLGHSVTTMWSRSRVKTRRVWLTSGTDEYPGLLNWYGDFPVRLFTFEWVCGHDTEQWILLLCFTVFFSEMSFFR